MRTKLSCCLTLAFLLLPLWASSQTLTAKIQYPGAFATYVSGSEDTQACGYFSDGFATHSFLLRNGHYHQLDYPQGLDTQVNGCMFYNHQAVMVGTYHDSAGDYHAFLYAQHRWVSYDHPVDPGGIQRYTAFTAINSQGQISGVFVTRENIEVGFTLKF